ncbi:hypothetical protein [Catalinimonas niigatensis]|uniref:hypothetical protein n=1 Tax=Catalinimonas niigatensis TaxID=1397264 RepID=UPI0026652EF6|nr:hypothetical protein [Catalinimonas niigatensis]WPP50704.1 hypothetical protein PZB72_28995 [Catalinimonas niigatensis]
METIKNVVLAKQANCDSDKVLSYALKLTNRLGAKLTIGLCYQYEPEYLRTSAYREVNPVKEAFQYVKHEYLIDSPVDYRLVSCETEDCDRADETLTVYLPDLYLMDKTEVHDLYSFIDRIHCPLLLLPPQIKYHPIQHILVVADLNEKDRDNIPLHAKSLAETFSASYEMMDIGDLSASVFDKKERKSSSLLSPKSDQRRYAHNLHDMGVPDLLVIMVKDKFFGVMKSFYGPGINLTQLLDFPVMIYKV